MRNQRNCNIITAIVLTELLSQRSGPQLTVCGVKTTSKKLCQLFNFLLNTLYHISYPL